MSAGAVVQPGDSATHILTQNPSYEMSRFSSACSPSSIATISARPTSNKTRRMSTRDIYFEQLKCYLPELTFLGKQDGQPYCKACGVLIKINIRRPLPSLMDHSASKKHKTAMDKFNRDTIMRVCPTRSRSRSPSMTLSSAVMGKTETHRIFDDSNF